MAAIYVDADACPVKPEVVRVAERHGLSVHIVSGQGVRMPQHPLVTCVVAGSAFDAADNWIAERAGPGDIVVTADIPLAARVLASGAAALGPTGRVFDKANIGMAISMRALMTDLRAMGEVSGHNASFTKADRSSFLQALENLVQRSMRP